MAASIITLLPLVSAPVVELNALRASCGYVDLQCLLPLGFLASLRWLHTYCCNKFTSIYLGETKKLHLVANDAYLVPRVDPSVGRGMKCTRLAC